MSSPADSPSGSSRETAGSARADVAFDTTVDHGGAAVAHARSGTGPVIAVALHAGHVVRPGLVPKMRLAADERLREEDPYTALFAPDGVQLVAGARSRFEVDLNRPRDKAIYRTPGDAWGLDIWAAPLDANDVNTSLAVYDCAYELLHESVSAKLAHHPCVVVLDLHSYNHRRSGPDAPAEESANNPEINLGTRKIDEHRWAPVIDTFIASLAEGGFDVRENVKFGGGHFAAWVEASFPGRACCLSIEFKKTFMDEWTGSVDLQHVSRNRMALQRVLPALLKSLESGLGE